MNNKTCKGAKNEKKKKDEELAEALQISDNGHS
jgi:hypothetical protein